MEINKDNWKQIDLNVDSLWLIPERDRQGKHKNIYHGNFVPQLLKRLRMPEIPCWSCSQAAGLPCSHMKTCAKITSDLPPPKKIIDYVNSIMSEWSSINYAIKSVDVTDRQPFSEAIAA